jgi:hypothetical protein
MRKIFVVLAVVVLAGCPDKKVGEACETYRSEECGGPGGACLAVTGGSNYCSHQCSVPTDCPTGFACKEITSTSYNGKGEKSGEKKIKMCTRSGSI